MCVEIVSLGKVALSTSRTLNPRRASSMAVGEPAHRAPMTMASYIVNLRVDRHYPNVERVVIGRITQNHDLVKLGNSAYAGQARHGRARRSGAGAWGPRERRRRGARGAKPLGSIQMRLRW